jgi:uncharacterized membrane protein
LAFLVPLYWLVGSFRLIMWVHAVSLAAVGPAVFVYARGRGLAGWTAFAFGVAALLHPSISQMSFAFSFGFHPVTIAMPAAILSVHFWERRKWLAFALSAAFAASMEETVFPFYVGVGIVELLSPGGRRMAGALLAGVSACLFLIVTKAVMPAFAGADGYFQMAKYAQLGGTYAEVLSSPFAKPGVFWALIFANASMLFVAVLLGCMLLLPLFAPKQLAYALVILVFTLLLVNPNVKIICYQYQCMVLAAWFPAMVAGAARLASWGRGSPREWIAKAAAVAAVLAACVGSHYYGLLPFSRVTMQFQKPASAEFLTDAARFARFAASVRPGTRVLATFRAGMYLCDAGDLTTLASWDGTRADYDLVVLQRGDDWGQSPDDLNRASDAMLRTGRYGVEIMGPFVVMTLK